RVDLIVYAHALSEVAAAPEAALPVAVTDERYGPAGLCLIDSEPPPEGRRHSDDRQETRRHLWPSNAKSLFGRRGRGSLVGVGGEPRKGTILVPKILEVRVRQEAALKAVLIHHPYLHQTLGAGVRQRSQKNPVHDTEDRGARADAERQHHYGDNSIAR